MKALGYLIAFAILGRGIWRPIFSTPSYPDSIPLTLKRTHALILCLISMIGLFSFGELVWLLFHPSQILASFASERNIIGSPLVGALTVSFGLFGSCLVPVLLRLAERRTWALKWYFVLWPLTYISASAMVITHHKDDAVVSSTVDVLSSALTMLFPTVIFILTLAFYSTKSAESLFNVNAEPHKAAC